jgi:hypothetical protein
VSHSSWSAAAAAFAIVVSGANARAQEQAAEPREEVPRASFLSRSPLLFDPLLADPRWPHFSAAWQQYHGTDVESVGAVSFGESFTFYRAPLFGAAIDVGFQASVFAIFDMDQESLDLVNADYLGGPVLAVRDGRWSGLLRLIHESSHLGDEYLLNNPTVERINLSYETVDGLLAWQPVDELRLYGGGGYIVHSDTELDRWLVHAGAEWLAPAAWGGVRPVAALDVQSREYTDWNVDVSLRAGVQFQDTEGVRGRVQLVAEYYAGSSPNGQFFVDEVEFVGVGLHFYF